MRNVCITRLGLSVVSLLIVSGFCSFVFSEETQTITRQQVDEWMKKAGQLYAEEKYDDAIELYKRAADHGNAWGQNNLAWVYATFKDPQLRDGERAVHYAVKATEQEPQNSHFFRTLAAAYARNKEFDNAVEAQQKAIELLPGDKIFSEDVQEELRKDHQKKLDLYRNQQAYIDEK